MTALELSVRTMMRREDMMNAVGFPVLNGHAMSAVNRRCRRLNLECKIESNFKRVGKRSKNAEMEREILELRRQLASAQGQTSPIDDLVHQSSVSVDGPLPSYALPSASASYPAGLGLAHTSPDMVNSQETGLYQTHTKEPYMGSHEAVASLLDLRQGYDASSGYILSPNGASLGRKLDDVALSGDTISKLFSQFFIFYHPFLPLLDPQRPPDHYYNLSPLLFWTILSIAARRFPLDPSLLNSLAAPVSRLVWNTLQDVPQSYHVVKALCLLCTWPLPTSSTSTDPTFMLSGVMTHVAIQIGLHRPSHTQDFSKFRIELRDEELKDRVKTWAACNIVAQSVGTGYGQPPSSLYDWTLEPMASRESSYNLPEELAVRLRIEKFCDKVTKGLYSNRSDPVGLTNDDQRSAMASLLVREFKDLEMEIGSSISTINSLHLRTAELHLRLSAFFDSSTAKDYDHAIASLYFATVSFLECALNLESQDGGVLSYCSNYILQMIVASGFTLLKLLNSFFTNHIDIIRGKVLFNRTVSAIRRISVQSNDLPGRLAEVLAQMWRGGEAGARNDAPPGSAEMDSSLQLKVRCRMSMSLVFDSVWRWREEFQAKGRGNLDVKNPTNPDSNAESSSNSSVDPNLAPPSAVRDSVTPGRSNSAFGESHYEVFDPLNWMLDGLVDFPYSLTAVQSLEAQGIA
ncbi:hypothetical protein FGG08_004435 [Glutinoglossum americanum]|uniref:Xylanolytic transcriptional activator regulatory domain-containing protein n=1 Tax=Glutinoglossum americanum TaxID=1670608 RepID=A0A9P8I0D9_9PEZI|nr:hypothetical protein FGG08_004435 [Glutinoglossum americanum]